MSAAPRRVLRRRAVDLVVVALLVLFAGYLPRHRAQAAPVVDPVTLFGEGSWDPMGEMLTWQNDLFGPSGVINLNYLPNGGFTGRQDLLSGSTDYAISGVPFTDAELATLPHGAADLVDAPVHVAALGLLASPPFGGAPIPGGWGVVRTPCLIDQNTGLPINPPVPPPPGFDEGTCTFPVTYSGPIKVPQKNLADLMLGTGTWNDPSIAKAFGIPLSYPGDVAPAQWQSDGNFPSMVFRSDPSETNFYFQQFAHAADPALWTTIRPGPITERLPILSTRGIYTTRPGTDQQVGFFEQDAEQRVGHDEIAPLPPYVFSAIQEAEATPTYHDLQAQWIQVQNQDQLFVAPTPDSINAAVNAGQDTPLYALSHNVGGATAAYPLVWIDHLYAPAHGLSIAKTEAIATVIRYMATAGQAATAAAGDGKLSDTLVSRALAAANQLVVSNCTGTGATITQSSDPGPYAPPIAALRTIGPMLHCGQAAIPTTTTTSSSTTSTTVHVTTTRPTTTTTSSSGTTAATGSSVSTSASTTSATTTTTTIATASGAGGIAGSGATGSSPPTTGPKRQGVLAVSKLPLRLPYAGGGGFDRLTALVVGAALYLLARKPLRSLVSMVRA